MKPFIQGFWKKPIRWWEISFYIIVISIGLGAYWYFDNPSPDTSSSMIDHKTYETIHPTLSESFSTIKILGNINSNQYAMIHPRREGIVKDILVDVGDQVTAGQAIAFLFPPGVEGESSSQIAKAKAELIAAQQELTNAERVASQSVSVAEKNVEQATTALQTTLQGGSEGERSTIQQLYDQAETVASQTFQNVKRVLFGDTLQARTSSSSIAGSFHDSIQEGKVFTLFQALEQFDTTFRKSGLSSQRQSIIEYLQKLTVLLDEMETLYRNASISQIQTENQISQNIRTIQESQTKILTIQDRIESAFLTVDQIEVTVDTAQKNLNLTESQAQKNIDAARNRVEVAQAAYSSQLAQSGHIRIVSPFSGKITARMADVGHMIKANEPLFEMVDVDTTLSQIAPLEVQFGVNEDWLAKIHTGDDVTVLVPTTHQTLKATITRKGASLESMSRQAMVHASFTEDVSLPHNTNVYVQLLDKDSTIFSVPSYSIKRRGNEYFVWVQDTEGSHRHLTVTILAEDGEKSDIESDLLTLKSDIIANPSVSLFRTSEPLTLEILKQVQDDKNNSNPTSDDQ